ncbi:MAG: histidinol-phosphate transaminase [Solirubrobacteraceae bacterium]
MSVEFADKIRRIPVYPLAAGYDLGAELAMLASNESAFAPMPEVVEAATRALTVAHRYPDPAYTPLRRALSERYGVPADRIALGNGSCEILLAAGDALLEPGAEVVYAWPAFSVYPHLAAASGARAIQVPLDAEECHDLSALAAQVTVATRLVLVCNPNNPTSTAVELEQVQTLLQAVPRYVCVILDEAYCEFSLTLGDPQASVELLQRWPNLVILRTFSKVYGLAALRCGYALCGSPTVRTALDQVRQPFYLNAVAQAGAVEALRHQDEVERRVVETIAARSELIDRVRLLGLRVASSDANFIWVRLPVGGGGGGGDGVGDRGTGGETDTEVRAREAVVVEGLRERGVLVRAGSTLGGPGAMRVTVGTPAENLRFVAALGGLIAR